MIIAASEKYMLGLISPGIGNFADLGPAILFLEVSVAALGGNLVASAFLLKAQVLHAEWKTSQIDVLAKAQGQLSQINRILKDHRSKQSQMPHAEYISKLDVILNKIETQEGKIQTIRDELDADGKL